MNYSIWIGDKRWFKPGAFISDHTGEEPRRVPMEEHLTTNPTSKAFLMAFAALMHEHFDIN